MSRNREIDEAGDQSAAPVALQPRWGWFVAIHIAAAALMVLPSFVLFFYGWSIGWWRRDPTNNDGPQGGIIIGAIALVACVVIVKLTAAVSIRAVRLDDPRPALRAGFIAVALIQVGAIWLYVLSR